MWKKPVGLGAKRTRTGDIKGKVGWRREAAPRASIPRDARPRLNAEIAGISLVGATRLGNSCPLVDEAA
jgi:hypothetical protein